MPSRGTQERGARPSQKAARAESRALLAAVGEFRSPSRWKSGWQLGSTAVLYLANWALMWWAMSVSYALVLLLAIPAAFLTVRFFIFSHDCGHGSFFASKKWNEVVGTITSVLAYTPYDQWRRAHAMHHAGSGQIEEASTGYFWTMTAQQYAAATPKERFLYRLYRNPVVLFGLGGPWLFLVAYRFVEKDATAQSRRSVWITNLSWLAITGIMGSLVGFGTFFAIQLPIAIFCTQIGLWLFFVQHHYEDAQWAAKAEWDYADACLAGSSFLDLGRVGHWLTGNIGYHHVHHLAPKVPNYCLAEAHAAVPRLRNVPRLKLSESFRGWNLNLIDAETGRWTTFGEVGRVIADGAPRTATPEAEAEVLPLPSAKPTNRTARTLRRR